MLNVVIISAISNLDPDEKEVSIDVKDYGTLRVQPKVKRVNFSHLDTLFRKMMEAMFS